MDMMMMMMKMMKGEMQRGVIESSIFYKVLVSLK